MKKVVALLMFSLLIASSAFAVVDDGENSMSFYFDLNADVYEMASAPYVTSFAYIILANPEAGAIFGYEFGFEVIGNFLPAGVLMNGTGPIDVGGVEGNHIVGLGAPMATSPATLLATYTFIPLDAAPISFKLKGAVPNSTGGILPNILLADSIVFECGLGAGLTDGLPNICAYFNGDGVVATDEASWDSVKSLYR